MRALRFASQDSRTTKHLLIFVPNYTAFDHSDRSPVPFKQTSNNIRPSLAEAIKLVVDRLIADQSPSSRSITGFVFAVVARIKNEWILGRPGRPSLIFAVVQP